VEGAGTKSSIWKAAAARSEEPYLIGEKGPPNISIPVAKASSVNASKVLHTPYHQIMDVRWHWLSFLKPSMMKL
jgi:hypothetical protein